MSRQLGRTVVPPQQETPPPISDSTSIDGEKEPRNALHPLQSLPEEIYRLSELQKVLEGYAEEAKTFENEVSPWYVMPVSDNWSRFLPERPTTDETNAESAPAQHADNAPYKEPSEGSSRMLGADWFKQLQKPPTEYEYEDSDCDGMERFFDANSTKYF